MLGIYTLCGLEGLGGYMHTHRSEHFSKSLDAKQCSMAALVCNDRVANINDNSNLSIDAIDWDTCPSFPAVARAFAHLRPMTGIGEDGLGSELFKSCPGTFASLFHPLFFKSALSLCPPLQLKGGRLFELFKGKGSLCDPSAYRDVTVCSASGKPFCRHLRSQAMRPLSKFTSATQFGGGLNGGATDFPRLYLEAARSIAKKNKLTFACIYIDLKSAFASIVRGIALEPLLSAEDLCRRLSARGFDDADIKTIADGIADFTFWQESGGSHHLSVLISRIHRCSWFAVDGVPGCYESRCGALAGTSLADVIFLLAFSRVLHAVEARLRSAGALFQLPAATVAARTGIVQANNPGEGLGQDLGPVAFVDDVAQPLVASASDIFSLVKLVIAIYHETFSRFLLTVNYSRGKSEVAFSFFGKGSALAKQILQHDFASGIPFKCLDRDLLLPTTLTYKHLGTISSSDCSMQPEITKKLATMKAATKAIRGDFLCRPNVCLDSRLLILKMLIFLKGLFQAGSWPLLYVSELTRVHKYLMDLFASIVDAGVARSARRPHESMLAVEGVIAPFILLLVLRN